MKFNLFKKIAENINKLFKSKTVTLEDNKSKNVHQQNSFFDQKFNDFFLIEDCIFCYQMIDEGYEPSASNRKQLNKILLEKIENETYYYNDIEQIKNIEPKTRIIALLKAMSLNNRYDYDVFNGKNKENIASKIDDENVNNFIKERVPNI